MRVISEWTYKTLRVQVMQMTGRYVLKLEDTLLEQTFKFRDGQITDLDHLRNILTDQFYDECISRFGNMRSSQDALFSAEEDTFEFDEII